MNKLNLKHLRKAKGMTQAEVAHFLQVERTTYGRYETGEREMTYEALKKLAQFYNVSLDYLLGRISGDCVVLEEEELQLILSFRKLDPRGRGVLFAVLEYEESRD